MPPVEIPTLELEDVKEIFGSKLLEFSVDSNTDASFEIAFDKSKSSHRKEWIANFNPNSKKSVLDCEDCNITYSITDHLQDELVKFFYDDCSRTLPNIFDGLKESQRKVLYAAKKRNLVNDLKVAQFGAYVAEHTGYHHGENNLFGTIIKMAQSYPGSNNIPLLAAEGMFGTRLNGGEDAASPRYIYTKMTKACINLFPDLDIYEQKNREGEDIEPNFYVPVLPTLLVNGCVGIASGWMCSCPSFNPEDIITNARNAINGKELIDIHPWFKGFKGDIVDIGSGKYETRGLFSIKTVGKKRILTVTELPIGMWNDKFKTACENDETIDNIKDLSTPDNPFYVLTLGSKFKEDLFVKKLLITTLNINNIVVFDKNNKIVKVTINDIFETWAKERIELNLIRKNRILKKLKDDENVLRQRVRFIELVRDKILILTDRECNLIKKMETEGIYDHKLLDLSVRQLTEENRNACMKKIKIIESEILKLTNLTAEEIWETDLQNVIVYL
jgi:DNA topoisomerase-2